MSELYLTAYNGMILGPIAKALGWIMDKIYYFLSNVCGVENVAVTIIVFTIFIYLCLFPLTYKQQKFSVLQRKMKPELDEIQKKYKGKKDQASMQAMQEETTALYDKYGVSMMGSCLQMMIQFPILMALFQVFNNIPAYVGTVRNVLNGLAVEITKQSGFQDTMTSLVEALKNNRLRVDFSVSDNTALKNYTIDTLYKLNDDGWKMLSDSFPTLTDSIDKTHAHLNVINSFLGLDISDNPWHVVTSSFASHQFGFVIIALLIPILAYVSQVISIHMMPTADSGNDQMAQQMKTMNTMMPLVSLFFTFVSPIGLGLYWIMGAVIRTIQMFFLNRHFEKINLDDIIEKNKEKAAKKKEKRGQMQIAQAAMQNTRQTRSMADKATVSSDYTEVLNKAAEARANAKSGSLSSKANLVKDFNERNNK